MESSEFSEIDSSSPNWVLIDAAGQGNIAAMKDAIDKVSLDFIANSSVHHRIMIELHDLQIHVFNSLREQM